MENRITGDRRMKLLALASAANDPHQRRHVRECGADLSNTVHSYDAAILAGRSEVCIANFIDSLNEMESLIEDMLEIKTLDPNEIIRAAQKQGGDSILLSSIAWHVEERVDLPTRIEYQRKHGSIMQVYVGYSQEVA